MIKVHPCKILHHCHQEAQQEQLTYNQKVKILRLKKIKCERTLKLAINKSSL
jgi:hypothetical protein